MRIGVKGVSRFRSEVHSTREPSTKTNSFRVGYVVREVLLSRSLYSYLETRLMRI